MTENISNIKRKVLIVGAGAAGMSCAATLARHPDKFEVTIIETQEFAGGQATSVALDKDKWGADFLNDGVQGGSPVFSNTKRWFKEMGFEARDVKLQISFGKGPDTFWTNVFPSPLVDKFKKDIKKFGKVIKFVKTFEIIFAVVPVWLLMKMFFFSKDFGTLMVFPLMALFLGTGNQTPNVSSAILVRLFFDPNMRLWDYSPETLLPNLPDMIVFPKLGEFYSAWADDLKSKGVDVRFGHEVVAVEKRDKHGVTVVSQPNNGKGSDSRRDEDASTSKSNQKKEQFDELVLAVLADDALKILGKSSTWKERRVLGSAKFFDDISVTHNDVDYIRKHYETEFRSELCKDSNEVNSEQNDQIEFAKKNFKPMYYVKPYENAPGLIEMTFNCSNYQYQFPKDLELERNVFQTIFLNNEKNHLWTKNEISKDKILLEKWWHQLGHVVGHYIKVVPWMWTINGKNKTYFAGAYTLVNMHELAVVSGMAAAYRLCKDYPFVDDEFGMHLFKLYLFLSHGVRYKKPSN